MLLSPQDMATHVVEAGGRNKAGCRMLAWAGRQTLRWCHAVYHLCGMARPLISDNRRPGGLGCNRDGVPYL